MSVWDKIKGALVEDESNVDPVTADPAEPVPDPNYVAPAEVVYPAAPGHHYAPQPPVALQPQVYYSPPPPSPATASVSPVLVPTPPSPAAAWPAPPLTVSPSYAAPVPVAAAPPPPSPVVGYGVPASPVAAPPAPSPRVAAPVAAPTSQPLPAPTSVSLEQINAIYQEQGVTQARYTAEQALRFLSAFPDDQLAASRRAALLGLVDSLRDTFAGLTPETLADDARTKIAVLEQTGHVRGAKFSKFESDMEREIENLREQIQQRRVAVEARRVQDQQLALLCIEHAERLKKLAALLTSPGGG